MKYKYEPTPLKRWEAVLLVLTYAGLLAALLLLAVSIFGSEFSA